MASMPHARLDLHDPCRDLTHRGAVWRCEVDESADESVWKMRSKLDWCYLMLDSPKIFSNLWSSFFTVSTKNTQMGFWIMSRWWQNSVGLVGLDVQNANMDLFKQRWKWLSINKAHLESPFLILQCFFYATGNLLSGFWFDPLSDLSGFEWIVPLPQGTNLPQTWRRSHHLRLSFVARCCPCVCFDNHGVIKICLVLEQLALQN